MIDQFGIHCSGPDAPMWSLSGGNQQRVVLARELAQHPKVLVAAQPTRGLDVGAIEYMSDRLRAAAADGVAVLLISSELEEILDLSASHRRDALRSDRRRDGPSRRRPRRARSAHGRRRRVTDSGTSVRRARLASGSCSTGSASLARPRPVGDPRRGDRWRLAAGRQRPARRQPPQSRAAGARRSGTAAPMLLVAVGTIVSGKAGLINIGQEGQLLVGAAFATYFGFLVGGPGPFNVVLILIFGCDRRWRCGPASRRCSSSGATSPRCSRRCCSSPSAANSWPTASGSRGCCSHRWPIAATATRSALSSPTTTVSCGPRSSGTRFPSRSSVGRAAALLVGFVLARTVWGFRLRMLGRNPRVAQRSGVAQHRLRRDGADARAVPSPGSPARSMLAGGGFAFGNYQLVPGFATNIGWTGLLVALVAREKVLVAIPVAVRVRRPPHRVELRRRHRRRGPHHRRDPGLPRARAAHPACRDVPS